MIKTCDEEAFVHDEKFETLKILREPQNQEVRPGCHIFSTKYTSNFYATVIRLILQDTRHGYSWCIKQQHVTIPRSVVFFTPSGTSEDTPLFLPAIPSAASVTTPRSLWTAIIQTSHHHLDFI